MSRKLTVIVWGDAHATLEEKSLEEIKGAHHASIIHTMGYIVHETDEGVTIAGEWIPADNGGDETFRSVSFIPKPWIIKRAPVRKKATPVAAPVVESGS